ncbi:MAG: UbiA family prenyltransferase [Candidatus ainarchaeum sp.]|nr:UbiA family prenyltransferase [Candidatus ainarchaeum sp.]
MKPYELIELFRLPTLLPPATGILSGAIASAVANGIVLNAGAIPALALASASAMLLNGASNSFNQACDVKLDKINKPTRPLPSGRATAGEATTLAAAAYAVALIFAAMVGTAFMLLAGTAALLTILYSWPAVRLKNHGWIANAAIALPRGLLLLVAGWSVFATPLSPAPWLMGSILGIFLLGAASTKDFADMEGDRRYGARTLPIIYGVRTAAWIMAPFLTLPFLLFAWGAAAGILPPAVAFLSLLSLWGAYIAHTIIRDPKRLASGENHPSWLHMYLLMAAAHLGIVTAYLI